MNEPTCIKCGKPRSEDNGNLCFECFHATALKYISDNLENQLEELIIEQRLNSLRFDYQLTCDEYNVPVTRQGFELYAHLAMENV